MIDLMNEARYFLPHLLALSTSSPFWLGRNSGLKSIRSEIFKRFPRTQIPEYFRSWHEYQKLVDLLVRTHCIDDVRSRCFCTTSARSLIDEPARHASVGLAAWACMECFCRRGVTPSAQGQREQQHADGGEH